MKGSRTTTSDQAPAPHWEGTLRDGSTVRVRPLRPRDREALAANFNRLSPQSRYRRFFSAMPKLPPSVLDGLLDVDEDNHVALVAIDDHPEGNRVSEGLGIARFVRLKDDPTTADAAVAVIDEHQGKGLGRLLLGRLVEAASQRGITHFRAHVLGDNEPMKHLLAKLAPNVDGRFEDGNLVYMMELPRAEDPKSLTVGSLYELFRAAAHDLAGSFAAMLSAPTTAEDPPMESSPEPQTEEESS